MYDRLTEGEPEQRQTNGVGLVGHLVGGKQEMSAIDGLDTKVWPLMALEPQFACPGLAVAISRQLILCFFFFCTIRDFCLDHRQLPHW